MNRFGRRLRNVWLNNAGNRCRLRSACPLRYKTHANAGIEVGDGYCVCVIPMGDTAVGYVYFRYLCATESGNRIYKTAGNVDGFYGSVSVDYFKLGYRFTEDRAPDGTYRRWTLGPNSRLTWETVPTLISRFGIRYSTVSRPMEIYLHRYEIYDLQTSDVYATSQNLGYRGGWIYTIPGKIVGMRSGGGFSCGEVSAHDELISQTLHVTR